MKKVILSVILLISSVFAGDLESFKTGLETYISCISALNDSIVVNEDELSLDQDKLFSYLFDSSDELEISESNSIDEELSSDNEIELLYTNKIPGSTAIELSFAENEDVLHTINKYSPKVIKYLTETLDDIETYVGIHGIVKTTVILNEAIQNAVFGKSRKMKEKRDILINAYTELISQM